MSIRETMTFSERGLSTSFGQGKVYKQARDVAAGRLKDGNPPVLDTELKTQAYADAILTKVAKDFIDSADYDLTKLGAKAIEITRTIQGSYKFGDSAPVLKELKKRIRANDKRLTNDINELRIARDDLHKREREAQRMENSNTVPNPYKTHFNKNQRDLSDKVQKTANRAFALYGQLDKDLQKSVDELPRFWNQRYTGDTLNALLRIYQGRTKSVFLDLIKAQLPADIQAQINVSNDLQAVKDIKKLLNK